MLFRNVSVCVGMYLERGFVLNVIPVDMFVPTLLGVCQNIDCDRFAKYIIDVAIQTKFKEETLKYIIEILEKHFEITKNE